MSSVPRILALAGSARRDSWNRKILDVAADGARHAGADVTVIDLHDYPIPLFDGDLEAASGLPEQVVRLKETFAEHPALLIASPEYNGSITPLLKNTLDWVSRPHGDEAPLSSYRGKTAALVSASPGGLGGLRALRHVREILTNLGLLVIPEQRAVSAVHKSFDGDGAMTDLKTREGLHSVGARLVEVTQALQ